jgi:glycosyltransferase involved in cell wall biosynthesis
MTNGLYVTLPERPEMVDSDTPVRVTHLVNSLTRGGAENAVVRLARSLAERGIENQIISILPLPMTHAHVDPRVSIHTLGFSHSFQAPIIAPRLIRHLRAHQSDILSSWLYHSDLLSALMRYCFGRNLAIMWNLRTSEKSGRQLGSSRFVRPALAHLSWTLPDAIVGNSNAVLKAHQELGYDPSRMSCIPNGYDTSLFKPSPRHYQDIRMQLNVSPTCRLVGMCARWHLSKDHTTFFEAARIVKQRRPDTHFLLCGAGLDPTNIGLSDLIAHHGLKSHISLLGTRDDMERVMAALDVAVLLSNSDEGFPNAVAEAMACGRCCVASNTGGTAEVIGDCGVLVPRKDPVAAAQAILGILDLSQHEHNRMGALARRRIEQCFTIRLVADQYLQLWRRLVPRMSAAA